jgi:hypothetical protein
MNVFILRIVPARAVGFQQLLLAIFDFTASAQCHLLFVAEPRKPSNVEFASPRFRQLCFVGLRKLWGIECSDEKKPRGLD